MFYYRSSCTHYVQIAYEVYLVEVWLPSTYVIRVATDISSYTMGAVGCYYSNARQTIENTLRRNSSSKQTDRQLHHNRQQVTVSR